LRIVLILVDALRHDWVTPEGTPHLHALAGEGQARRLRDTFGFIGIRGALFYGLSPAESGYVFLWERDPARSQLRALRWVPAPLKRPGALRALIRAANRLRRARRPGAAPFWDIAGFPPRLIHRFRFAEPHSPLDPRYLPGRRSLFSPYRPEEVLYLGYPGADQRTSPLLREFGRRFHPGVQLLWLHFAELDWAQHRWGPSALYNREVLREIDAAIGVVLRSAGEIFVEPYLVAVFGDHGAVEVRRHLDLETVLALEAPPLRGRVEWFLDSTMARFWSEDRTALQELRARLAALEEGRVVELEELPSLHCRWERRTFGDLLFCADPGVYLFPNFFQREEPCRGIHGYLPGAEDDEGALVVAARGAPLPEVPPSTMEMQDLHRLLQAAQGGAIGGLRRPPLRYPVPVCRGFGTEEPDAGDGDRGRHEGGGGRAR
jgi:hypothetical protein